MHDEYYEMVEELKNVPIEVDLPIRDLIKDSLIGYEETNSKPLDNLKGFGYRYQKPLPPPIPGTSARLGKCFK